MYLVKLHRRDNGRVFFAPIDKIESISVEPESRISVTVGGVRCEAREDITYLKEQYSMAAMPRWLRKIYKWLKKVSNEVH